MCIAIISKVRFLFPDVFPYLQLLALVNYLLSFPSTRTLQTDDVCIHQSNSLCFSLFNTEMNWTEARETCRKEFEGELMRVEDKYTGQTLVQMVENINVTIWTAGRKQIGDWSWSTNIYTFNNNDTEWWDNYNDNSNLMCASTSYPNFRFIARDCSTSLALICEMDLSSSYCMSSTQDTEVLIEQNKCYLKFSDNLLYSWNDALKECRRLDADLVTMTTETRQVFVNFSTISSEFWIGLSKYQWIWQTDKPVDIYKLFNNVDFNQQGDCLIMKKTTTDIRWEASGCQNKHQFVCQRESSSVMSAVSSRSTMLTSLTSPYSVSSMTWRSTSDTERQNKTATSMAESTSSLVIIIASSVSMVTLAVVLTSLFVLCRKRKLRNSTESDKNTIEQDQTSVLNFSGALAFSNTDNSYQRPHFYRSGSLRESQKSTLCRSNRLGSIRTSQSNLNGDSNSTVDQSSKKQSDTLRLTRTRSSRFRRRRRRRRRGRMVRSLSVDQLDSNTMYYNCWSLPPKQSIK